MQAMSAESSAEECILAISNEAVGLSNESQDGFENDSTEEMAKHKKDGTDRKDDADKKDDADINDDSDGKDDAERVDEDDEMENIGFLSDNQEIKTLQPMTKARLEQFTRDHRRSGVVYMSRIPPYMKPPKVKHMLGKFGEIGRIYFAAEGLTRFSRDSWIFSDDKHREFRLKRGGNKKVMFRDGWIEFKDKKVAKSVAASLNSTLMGGKKTSFYHDDIWNLKYLSSFKWIHLTQQLASERQDRLRKLQTEIHQAKKEVGVYMKKVEKSKMLGAMELKRQKQSLNSTATTTKEQFAANATKRHVRQRKVILDHSDNNVVVGADKQTQNFKVSSCNARVQKLMKKVGWSAAKIDLATNL